MAFEQTLPDKKRQLHSTQQIATKPIERESSNPELPLDLTRFLQQSIGDTPIPEDSVVLPGLPEMNSMMESAPGSGESPCVVGLHRLNDIRYINKFLEVVNSRLPDGGWIIGCVETNGQRHSKIMRKYPPKSIGRIIYFFDFLIHRVWPKLPHLRKLYFHLLKGKGRALSEMETIGRLISCGFKLINAESMNEKYYFIAFKNGSPAFNYQASYDPLIRLQRAGKDGKPIKVLKLRTMYPYSEYLQEYIYEQQGLQEGGKFSKDPRINSVGRFMRKSFLDELPMIINLFRGDVKLVGVRPLSKHYLSLYPPSFQEYRNKFKPGLIPPYYVDMPKSIDEIVESERRYLEAYEKHAWRTDFRYMIKAIYNIIIKKARSF